MMISISKAVVIAAHLMGVPVPNGDLPEVHVIPTSVADVLCRATYVKDNCAAFHAGKTNEILISNKYASSEIIDSLLVHEACHWIQHRLNMPKNEAVCYTAQSKVSGGEYVLTLKGKTW